MSEHAIHTALTIAGSDSGGGAGIEADLKTFAILGVYGMAAITSVTAQNTVGVTGIHDLPADFVVKQIDTVADDIRIDAAKTGMLSTAEIVEAVAGSIRRNRIDQLVVDPVMIAKSGDALLQATAQDALRKNIVPLAFLLTPNIPEAEALTGRRIDDEATMKDAARALHDLGARNVLIKGGHAAAEDAVDWLFDGQSFHVFAARRIDTKNTHGTGCTLSAAIAAFLARDMEIQDAVRNAKDYLSEAIRHSLEIGRGHGPLDHAWPLRAGDER